MFHGRAAALQMRTDDADRSVSDRRPVMYAPIAHGTSWTEFSSLRPSCATIAAGIIAGRVPVRRLEVGVRSRCALARRNAIAPGAGGPGHAGGDSGTPRLPGAVRLRGLRAPAGDFDQALGAGALARRRQRRCRPTVSTQIATGFFTTTRCKRSWTTLRSRYRRDRPGRSLQVAMLASGRHRYAG